MVDRRRTGWLAGWLEPSVANPVGHVWYSDLWRWGRLCSHRDYGRMLHWCLITEQGHTLVRWGASGLWRHTRLGRRLTIEGARSIATGDRSASVVTRGRRRGRGTRWEERVRDDSNDKCSRGN
ncbi:MAG: hypothetical protein M3Y48_00885 [Actinomycetota bacterium]|nr:hypothetical protein [Actinomycetota bacterium]